MAFAGRAAANLGTRVSRRGPYFATPSRRSCIASPNTRPPRPAPLEMLPSCAAGLQQRARAPDADLSACAEGMRAGAQS